MVYLLIMCSLGAFAVGGYLQWKLPPGPPSLVARKIDEHSSPADAFASYDELQQGLQPAPAPLPIDERRNTMLWGMRIALALGQLGLAAAAEVAVI